MDITDRYVAILDEDGNIVVDQKGFVTFKSTEGGELRLQSTEINFNAETLCCNVDNTNYIPSQQENIHLSHVLDEQTVNSNSSFSWNDAATRLFLSIYKDKKDLISSRKIRSYKFLWKEISKDMLESGYNVNPIQVENKFKTLERAYKNMIANNKKTGRERSSCSYEEELTDILGKKHNVIPLAVSGRNGLVLRESIAHTSTSEENSLEHMTNEGSSTMKPATDNLVSSGSNTAETNKQSYNNVNNTNKNNQTIIPKNTLGKSQMTRTVYS